MEKRNGKGKEYYEDGQLLFEGEYLNGKRNGKGKEYYEDGQLEFEGEYINDIKWDGIDYDTSKNKIYELKDGLIKEYDYGKLIFEGEYNKNREFIFEGEYFNGLRNGKGKEYYNDGQLKFEGEYLNSP